MPKLLERQDPPPYVPEPPLVDGLRIDGRDAMAARRALIRAHNTRRQRGELEQQEALAVVVAERGLWVFGGEA